jgi:hypothetical protein
LVQSKRTLNWPVQWLDSHRLQVPVMRAFQSVLLGSNRQKVLPAFETVIQGLVVPGKFATLQPEGIGTSH